MKSPDQPTRCMEAEEYYYEIITGDTTAIPGDVLDHIAGCGQCAARMRRLENSLGGDSAGAAAGNKARAALDAILKLHFAHLDRPVTCRSARPFLPGLLDERISIRIPTPITAHLDHCPRCRGDMELIRKAGLDGDALSMLSELLAGRPAEETDGQIPPRVRDLLAAIGRGGDSGVVTLCRVARDAASADGPYGDFPISVAIVGTGRGGRGVLRFVLKAALPVAAAVVIAAAFLLTSRTAAAVSLDRIYSAIRKAANIHIKKFGPGAEVPAEEQWISRPLGRYILRTADMVSLWDFPVKLKKKRGLPGGRVILTEIPADMIAALEGRIMNGALGMMPFYGMADLPEGATWTRIDNAGEKSTGDPGVMVYDLDWSEELSDGSVAMLKWRVSVEPGTYLPRRVTSYKKLAGEKAYTITSLQVVESIDADDIAEAARAAGLQ